MRIAVLGGGIVGVTTAWELAEDGHEVSLIEQDADLAAGTSFANGGQIAVGESGPWSTPDLARRLWEQWGAAHPPFRLRLRMSPRQWRWLLQFLRQCAPPTHRRALVRNFLLARYSQQRLAATRRKLGGRLRYDAEARGILQLYACRRSWDSARRHASHLQDETGAQFATMDAAACVAHEPALAHAFERGLYVGGVLSPGDESGDARVFAQQLGASLAGRVRFHMGVRAEALRQERGKVVAVATDAGEIEADAVVVALGCASHWFLRRFGVSLPILPLKGYSLTLPNVSEAAGDAPHTSLTDYGQRLVLSRLGSRLRVAGYAEVGYGAAMESERVEGLRARLQRLFPAAGDYAAARPWCGFRPMSADGAPFIGAVRRSGLARLTGCLRRPPPQGLYVNAGHGSLGWTFAHGSARLLADLISNHPPALDADAFAAAR